MNKNKFLTAIGLLLVLFYAGSAAGLYQLSFVEKLSAAIYDLRVQLAEPIGKDNRIVIIDVDDKSLAEEGRWPWSRDKLALLVDRLFDDYHVAVTAFDVVFAETDHSSGLSVLMNLRQGELKNNAQFQEVVERLRPHLEYDSKFAKSLSGRNVVLGYYFMQSVNHQSGMLPEPVWTAKHENNTLTHLQPWTGYGANLLQFQQEVIYAGHFNPLVDEDGVVRRAPMLVEYNGGYYESLSLAVVRAYLGNVVLKPGQISQELGDYRGMEWLTLARPEGALKVPLDRDMATLIPYRGSQGSFQYVSASDVLNNKVDKSLLQGKIVLVGTSALGLLDMRSTPVDEVFPGVEIHANLISGILGQTIKAQPAYMIAVETLWLIIIGAALSFGLPELSARKAILLSTMSVLLTVELSLFLWDFAGLWLSTANTLVLTTILFVLNTSYGYLFESRTRRQITGLFGQYVPKELVGEMSKHPESLSMHGESKELTVLFTDVRGFTSIAERLEPKELTMLMNEFLTPLSKVVYKHRGTIDKYMGDCIMAFWGAPLSDPDHAHHAIEAALAMQRALKELKPIFKQRGWPEIEVGIGLNTGRMSVGNMGSEVRVAYTVMGDEVNLASRLEGLTKKYGVSIIVGENTMHQVPGFIYREVDLVRVKGKDKPVLIYEPIGLVGMVSSDRLAELEIFHKMRGYYFLQRWVDALEQLKILRRLYGEAQLYSVYEERIVHFQQLPSQRTWDGVFVFEDK